MDIFSKVTSWMRENARPVEAVRYAFLFLSGSPKAYLDELAKYQTPSGGFGGGLEPDFRNPNPSPIQTWTAIHYLKDLDLPNDHQMVKAIAGYLKMTMGNDGYYPFKIPTNNDYPHAIWWHYDEKKIERDYNPSVALWAYLYLVSKDARAQRCLTSAMIDFVKRPKTEMHELKCFIDAYEWLYHVQADFLEFHKFETVLKETIFDILKDFRKESLKVYGPTPLGFCDDPKARLYPLLKPHIDIQMEEIIKEIEHNDMWDINFVWGQYAEEFIKARRHWQGVLGVKYSRFLSCENKKSD